MRQWRPATSQPAAKRDAGWTHQMKKRKHKVRSEELSRCLKFRGEFKNIFDFFLWTSPSNFRRKNFSYLLSSRPKAPQSETSTCLRPLTHDLTGLIVSFWLLQITLRLVRVFYGRFIDAPTTIRSHSSNVAPIKNHNRLCWAFSLPRLPQVINFSTQPFPYHALFMLLSIIKGEIALALSWL